jgi:hypothetical protein
MRAARKADKQAEKAAKQAAKAARPKKTRWFKQLWNVFQMTREAEPLIWLWMLLLVVGVAGVAILIGWLAWPGHIAYMAVLGTPMGLLGALYLLMMRAERAAYGRIEGQEGASSAAIGQVKRGWVFDSEPVALDPGSHAMVFRGVGRAGVALVGEGPSAGRLAKLVEREKRKVARVAPDIPVVVFVTGREEGQVPLYKLARTIQRQRPKLSKAEVAVVQNRLKALGGLRPPIPKGVDPLRARPDRKALRGR